MLRRLDVVSGVPLRVKGPHLESKNTRTPVPQRLSYQAYGLVRTRRLDLTACKLLSDLGGVPRTSIRMAAD